MTFENIEDQLNLYNELRIGDIVGHTNRIVIVSTKLGDRIPGDSYARWIAICHKEEELHPYVVWDIVARPEGFSASNGDYFYTIEDALVKYKQRKGKA